MILICAPHQWTTWRQDGRPGYLQSARGWLSGYFNTQGVRNSTRPDERISRRVLKRTPERCVSRRVQMPGSAGRAWRISAAAFCTLAIPLSDAVFRRIRGVYARSTLRCLWRGIPVFTDRAVGEFCSFLPSGAIHHMVDTEGDVIRGPYGRSRLAVLFQRRGVLGFVHSRCCRLGFPL